MKEAKRLKKWLRNRNKIIDDYRKASARMRDSNNYKISKNTRLKERNYYYLVF